MFICENNLFSSHLRIDQRQTDLYTSRFAKAHNIESIVLDGNNVTELYNFMKLKFNSIRESYQPLFIEALTYRWKGHVGYREDEDVGVADGEGDEDEEEADEEAVADDDDDDDDDEEEGG